MRTNQVQQRDGARRNSHGLRFSRFVFTINGTPQQLAHDMACLKTLTPKWLIAANETCPTTQRKHIQGACILGKQVAFTTLKNMPGFTRAHIEVMKGTPAQSREYCTKEDKEPYEYGTMPQQGKRNDLQDAIAILKEGTSIRDLILTADLPTVATYVRYPKGLTSVSQAFRERQGHVQPFVLWLHGSTGVGKTRCALELAEYLGCGSDVWVSNASLQWFDGYDGQRVAVLDDYRTNHCKFSTILRLLDRYRFSVPFKGGFVLWQPLFIIITTPKSARAMWNLRTEEDIAQLERRITLSVDVDGHEDGYDVFRDTIFGQVRERVSESPHFSHLAGLLPADAMDLSADCDRSADSSESGAIPDPVELGERGGRGSGLRDGVCGDSNSDATASASISSSLSEESD
nr:MAG: putative replication protein [Circovirus sp. gt1AU]